MAGARNNKKSNAKGRKRKGELLGEDREKVFKDALERIEAVRGSKKKEIEVGWELACSAANVDAETTCAEACEGRNSPFCICSCTASNKNKRKTLWRKDADLLAGVGENPALFERQRHWNEPEHSRNVPDPAGLLNLGATCYANSVLQCLFNVIPLRRELLKLSLVKEGKPGNEGKEQAMILSGLHNLFAEMQFGPLRVVNPEHFLTKILQLKGSIQQDCQEFWTLLHSSMDTELRTLRSSRLHSLLNSIFVGQTSYKTVCSQCNNLSESSRNRLDFQVLELEMRESANLENSLEAYLEEEVLAGDNQYYCPRCSSRQNALRSIQIHSLPPHLILQLKRFKFDMKTFQRKKIKSSFTFPTSIDFGPFLADKSKGSKASHGFVYDIQSIILHRGKNASEGHYISLVKREEDNLWWQFDDQHATCIGKDLDKHSYFSRDSTRKDHFTSTQVYVMVFKKREATKAEQLSDPCQSSDVAMKKLLPEETRKRMGDLLSSHSQSKVNFDEKRDNFLQCVKTQREQVEMFFELSKKGVDLDSAHCADADALSAWTGTIKDSPSVVDMSPHLCRHNLIDPTKVGNLKVINKGSWDILKRTMKPSKDLSPGMLCSKCLKELFEKKLGEIEFRKTNAEMLQLYHSFLKDYVADESYFVSRKWLKRWLKGAADVRSITKQSPTEDIICKHGCLALESVAQRSFGEVPGKVWRFIVDSCSEMGTPTHDLRTEDDVCSTCMSLRGPFSGQIAMDGAGMDSKGNSANTRKRKIFAALKDVVNESPIFLSTRETYNALPLRWFYEWAKVLDAKPCDESHASQTISNFVDDMRSQFCPHGKLLRQPYASFIKVQDKRNSWKQVLNEGNILLVSSVVWKKLASVAGIPEGDLELRVKLFVEKEDIRFWFEPNTCHCCSCKGKQEDLQYHGKKMWVYGSFGTESERSARKRKMVMEIDSIDSSTTLAGLKKRIQGLGSSSVDCLFYCQQELQNNQATMSALEIMPGDVLRFESVNGVEGSSSSDGETQRREENTFEGTRLLS
mmetsp:Transcript_10465/g.26589  ORF Transcript_10465/g.26589 Transcript_10465/m.26589 type:complete len:1024 (-) Transcript_10465:2375-5446(-)|eukprot:CAMPEP_0198244226 /NCGR_PEP_ID=MMETSP1446-20131203/33727_1 /TAXON_ID=1461542 ORGANISM="Unidentified sp, Strain CCMP2111" /NCGR_SAMPLE_ID=MMETSP1446 /ASSEMBLY_ACC=CAM_ASM_001112 /LENGTH=1023 /DNA_ID=CAMNT_0043928225 /DNA_START=51 /DNA_END=3122 /DNA_ORIENTATION=+